MATLTDSARFARDPEVRAPLTAAIAAAAVQIMAEDPSTANHQGRLQLATRVLNGPDGAVDSFVWAVSSNATVVDKWMSNQTESAIGDFAFVVSTVWNAVAGIGL